MFASACGPVAKPTAPGPLAPRVGNSGTPDASPAPAKPDAPPPRPAGPGESNETAIEVCKPGGQLAYLGRLRCLDGAAPTFERIGLSGYRSARKSEADFTRSADQVRSMRPLAAGERDLHPVDAYALTCANQQPTRVYLDMYHCDSTATVEVAPPGWTLAPVEAPEPADAPEPIPES